MRKNKILILANTFYPVLGGVETFYLDLIGEISKERDMEAHIIAYTYFDDKNNVYKTKYDNVKINLLRLCAIDKNSIIERLERSSHLFYFFYTIVPLFIYTFFYCLKNKNFYVIHANSHTTGVVAVLISRIFGIKKRYLSMHGVMFSKSATTQKYYKFRERIKKQFKKFDKIFCIGQKSYDEILDLLGGDVSNNKLELFRYWANDSYFNVDKNKQAAKSRLGLGKKKIVFYAGRLVPQKGLLLLLEVAEKMPQYDFVIAGDGILKEKVKESSGKYNNIKFLGKIENNLMADYYVAADISILLSHGVSEGMPRAVMESSACGTPILATASGGTIELIAYDIGIIVEYDVSDIRNKIGMILEDKEDYARKQENCYLTAKKYFSKQNARLFIENYQV